VIELAAFDQHAFAFPEINFFFLQSLLPGMIAAIRKEEEESFVLHALAISKQRLQPPWAEIGQPLHELTHLMEAFVAREFVKQLKDRAFGRGEGKRPIPLPPGLNSDACVSALSSSPWASGFQLNPSSLRMICSSLKSLRSLCQTKRESSGNLKSQLGGCFGPYKCTSFLLCDRQL
jgi:hypothetical protein